MTAAVTDRYRTAQDKLTRQAVTPSLALLRAIPTGGVLTDAEWLRLLAILLPHVTSARASSRDLAADVYALTSPRGTAPDIGPSTYDVAALAKGLTAAGVRQRLTDPLEHAPAALAGASVVGRHVEMAGRDFMRQATYGDDEAHGWARVARGARTCAFCLMLISRGPVYSSGATAGLNDDGTMNAWHIRCDCQAVPVFDLDDWPGREQYLRAEQMWAETTGHVSGTDKLNAFRRAVESDTRTGTGDQDKVAKADEPPKAPHDVTDDEMDDALQAAIQSEDWDRFEALSEEADRRQEAAARKASESAARAERRRQQKDRERAAQLDQMSELIEQGVPEAEAYAEAYGVSMDQAQRTMAIDSLRSAGYQGSSFEKLARQSYSDHVYREWLAAEEYTRGAMLNKQGRSLGVDDKSLFSGSYDRAVKYASEELLTYWEENGRYTFTEWQAHLLGDGAVAAEARRRGTVIR